MTHWKSVVKLRTKLDLTDLLYASEHPSGWPPKDGDKVNFLLRLKNKKKEKDKWKFVKGTLQYGYVSNCECCGPNFWANLVKADGTVVCLVADGWTRGAVQVLC